MATQIFDPEILNEFGVVKAGKTATKITGENKKSCVVSKRTIQMEDYDPEWGGEMTKEFDKETRKRRHLGKVRFTVRFKTEDELRQILTKYLEL